MEQEITHTSKAVSIMRCRESAMVDGCVEVLTR